MGMDTLGRILAACCLLAGLAVDKTSVGEGKNADTSAKHPVHGRPVIVCWPGSFQLVCGIRGDESRPSVTAS